MKALSILRKVLFISLFSSTLSAQIVNVENLRMAADTSAWRFQSNFDLNIFRNTTTVMELEHDLALRYNFGPNRFIFLSSLHFNSTQEQSFAQSGFFHLRYVRSLNNWLSLEAFTQYQTDRPLKIETRQLQGFGPRFRLAKSKSFSLFTGHLFMYEFDQELSTEIEHRDWRLSSYFSMDWVLKESMALTSVFYYQPRLDKLDDFRFNWQNQLAFKFSKHWAFTLEATLFYDANPVIDPAIPNFTYKLTNGIKVDF